ncbi:MAG: alpha/beta hydrolase [Deltaproteobacteria bacterium]|nr:alpha/beta hydrolase [Deltaproteobacteria bacterium]
MSTDAGFPAVTEFEKRGPFETRSGSEGPACVIHHPKDLGQGGLRHPIIVWGNGTMGFPAVYAGLLDHWASHGFIVAAAKTTNAGTGKEMLACAEFLIRKDDEVGHKYEGKVDTKNIGASGHSQGGGGSIMAGADDRVTITAPLQPYVIGLGHQTSSQSQQSGPMFIMTGGKDTIAPPAMNQAPVFNNSNVPTFWGTLKNADHAITPLGNAGGFRGPSTAWFRLHLMGDENARSMFYGEDCGLCTNSNWTNIQRKDME